MPTVTLEGTADAWTASWIHNAGDRVVHNGRIYRAKWYRRKGMPENPIGPWQDLGTY